MLEHAPVVVGIIGASGSGKTTLARALVAALPADEAVILPLDAYYRDLSHLDAARTHQRLSTGRCSRRTCLRFSRATVSIGPTTTSRVIPAQPGRPVSHRDLSW